MTDSEKIVQLVAEELDRPLIRIKAGQLSEIATKAETILIDAGLPIYRRGAFLVRPVVEEVDAFHGGKTTVAILHPLEPTYLRDILGRIARWERFDIRKNDWLQTNPPPDVAAFILARYGDWSFPRIAGILSTPTLRPDGTILSKPGYDPDSGFFLAAPPELPPIPAKPTKDDAIAALGHLNELLEEFPFVDEPARGAALSALITPVVRGAFTCAPMHVARAPVPASGKSYLFDVAAAIVSGQPCPVMAAGRTEEETEKRLGASLLTGQCLISLDNVSGELGGDFLCQAVDRPIVQIRILGKSERVSIEARGTTFYATGNNIVIVGDMTRRAVVITLDPHLERPELHEFSGNPLATVFDDRGRYIAAALTICRAYAVAGRPNPAPRLASFEGWSDTVRSALMWLGCGDAAETMETSRSEDPDLTALREIAQAWADAFGVGFVNQRSVADAMKDIEERESRWSGDGDPHDQREIDYKHPALREAVLAGVPSRGRLNARVFGKWLGRHKGRIAGGLKFMRSADTRARVAGWWVEAAGEIQHESEAAGTTPPAHIQGER